MNKKIDTNSIIRVNHAGESAAVRIYEGQLRVLGESSVAPTLYHMLYQEQTHLEKFEAERIRRNIALTSFHPLWHRASYALGMASALFGKEAAMACTVAVEEVIDEHYAAQLVALKESPEEDLKNLIHTCHQEELEHKEEAEDLGNIGYSAFKKIIKTGCRLAIYLSERG
jgi:ubiquinone biosynthesis monooxygenase Coq7